MQTSKQTNKHTNIHKHKQTNRQRYEPAIFQKQWHTGRSVKRKKIRQDKLRLTEESQCLHFSGLDECLSVEIASPALPLRPTSLLDCPTIEPSSVDAPTPPWRPYGVGFSTPWDIPAFSVWGIWDSSQWCQLKELSRCEDKVERRFTRNNFFNFFVYFVFRFFLSACVACVVLLNVVNVCLTAINCRKKIINNWQLAIDS